MKFNEFNLDENLLKGITDVGFEDCTPVQEKTFKETLNGKDVLVQSQTGTGKTAAFLISIYQILLTEKEKYKKALIVAPTRELAIQIEQEANTLGKELNFKTGSFYGGVGYGKQEQLLKDGVDIIIATPGRLLDFSNSEKIKLKEVDIVVIDEADRLFDMGFLPDIRKILKKTGNNENRRTMLFSATLSSRVRYLSDEFMKNSSLIEIEPEQITVDRISQELYHVGTHEKMSLLLGILKKHAPQNTIIFTNTKHKAFEVAQRLTSNNFKTKYIIGDLPQNKRLKVLDSIKNGEIEILVATDVAARGLHVNDLDLVINYDLPADSENYVHRIGRTARAGKTGKAISMACEEFVMGLKGIEEFSKTKIPVAFASDEMFIEDNSAGKTFRLERKNDDKKRNPNSKNKPKTTTNNNRKNVSLIKSNDIYNEGRKHDYVDKVSFDRKKKPSTKKAAQNIQKKPNTIKSRNNQSLRKEKNLNEHFERPNVVLENFKRDTLENRLKYYEEKYGEKFTVSSNAIKNEKKKGFINKLLNRN